MNKYITFFGTVFIIIVLILTNPDREKHSIAVKEILTKEFHKTMTDELQKSKNDYQRTSAGLGLLLGATVIDKIIDGYIDSENFYLFSLTKVNLKGEQSTGLGMSIIKTIVEWHEGTIWFESEEGKGTTFFIKLPKR